MCDRNPEEGCSNLHAGCWMLDAGEWMKGGKKGKLDQVSNFDSVLFTRLQVTWGVLLSGSIFVFVLKKEREKKKKEK